MILGKHHKNQFPEGKIEFSCGLESSSDTKKNQQEGSADTQPDKQVSF